MSTQPKAERAQPQRHCCENSKHSDLRTRLEHAHHEIESCVTNLESVSGQVRPEHTNFSTVRLRIGRAIMTRRQVGREVYGQLMSIVSAEDAEAVRDLHRRDLEQFHRTSEIIRHWTPQMVQDDWRGYCDASRKVRDGLLEIVAAEKRLLYPLLQQLHGH